MDCIFCKIVSGEIPSYRLYEDDDFLVILDRFPSRVGHTLIVPKQHFATIFELPEDLAQKIMPLATKVAQALQEVTRCDGMNLLQNNGTVAGQSVHHFHMHLIPRWEGDSVQIHWQPYDPKEADFDVIMEGFSME